MLGIKERRKYLDISWLMPSVDVVGVLERLGCERISVDRDEVRCLCPEHEAFVGRVSSHPNWTCNIHSGKTYCRTEPRGSNLLWTVCRILGCPPSESVQFMTGREEGALQSAALLGRISRLKRGDVGEKVDPVRLDDIKKDLKNRYISDACYEFFMHPPGKAPTLIERATVDRYLVFERRWGYYSNRTIIPFFMQGELVGFCAVDLLGKDRWLLEHPLKDEDDYRKILYPLNFRSKECLFGYDDCKQGEDLIVTEGAREVMKLWQMGFTNTVGCLKADLSPKQILLISKLAPRRIILMFDGDTPGYAATEKNAKKLEDGPWKGKVVKFFLPVGKDPKNMTKEEISKKLDRQLDMDSGIG